jgi:hypothetical protein
MRTATDKLRVDGEISPTLLANLDELQMVWHRWLPKRYSPILIEPEAISPAGKVDGGAVTAFSGGVDSTFTVYRHLAAQPGSQLLDLRETVFVTGFDIPLDAMATSNVAFERAQRLLDGLAIQTARVRSNIRQLDVWQPWINSFGIAVSSALLLFQRSRSVGLLPSSEPYDRMLFPWGSTPVQDWMASTDLMEIRHDGAGYGRIEKIAALSKWEPARHHLRVCWEGDDLGRNCGRCEKCIRTILCFWAIGDVTPPCFDRSPAIDEISKIKMLKRAVRSEFEMILEAAEKNGLSRQRWVIALRRRLRRARARVAISSMNKSIVHLRPGVPKR